MASPGRLSRAGAWTLILLLVTSILSIGGEAPGGSGLFSAAWAAPVDDNNDEDEEEKNEDYPDDGSAQLISGNPDSPPAGLTPISPAEEKGLLGNWGDAAGEGED